MVAATVVLAPSITPEAPWLQRARAAAQSSLRGPALLLEEPPQGPCTPSHECGVSLAWLRRFAKLAGQVLKPGLPTEHVIQKLVVCLSRSQRQGKLRLYDLVPKEHRGIPQYYIVHTWSDALDRVIEQACSHVLANAPPQTAEETAQDHSTANTPRGAHSSRSLDQARQQSARVDHHAAEQLLLENTFVWVDVCANNQHACTSANVAPPNLDEVRLAVTTAQLGTLVVMDQQFDLLNRCWCMYESWLSVYHGDCQKLHVLFPEEMSLDDLVQFQGQCANIELVRGLTSKPADKQRIVAEVKHKVGVRRMQQLLPESLMRSARAGLRWSGSMAKVSMYCAMLLKNREWYQAQSLLHSMPEIHDDEKMLQDIRDVFKLYDTDGSGELDRDEFVEVLGVAGFTNEEAHNIFGQVDVDNGGSVSLQEFESWWIESQRQQSTRHNAKCDYTANSLVVNLTAMITLLERQGLQAHVPFYRSAVSLLEHQARGLEAAGRPPLALIPAAVKGDWHGVAEQCAWKVTNRDYKGAAKLMYGLLLWNADTLRADPAQLTNPDNTDGAIAQVQLLCNFMETFSRLLAAIPTNYRQAEYFMKASEELKEGVLEVLLDREAKRTGVPRPPNPRRKKQNGIGGFHASSSCVILDDDPESAPQSPYKDKSKGKGKKVAKKAKLQKKPRLFPGKFDMQREGIVSDMVKLKYGPQTLITAQQIVEAEKSLSAWMAAQKSNAGRGLKADDRGAVADFTTSYLTVGSSLLARSKEVGPGERPGIGYDNSSSNLQLPAIGGAARLGEDVRNERGYRRTVSQSPDAATMALPRLAPPRATSIT